MLQRISSLFFGSAEEVEVSSELKGPKPCVTEADEEGWLLVNLPVAEDRQEVASVVCTHPLSECPSSSPPHKSRRKRAGRSKGPPSSSLPACSPSEQVELSVSVRERASRSCSNCSMDESWFVTPPPCFTAEGATAEASPMEDLLIEHPSMSVYVSPGTMPAGEESTASLSTSARMSEQALPAVPRNSMTTRVTRGATAQANTLAKVTQVSRVQRARARTERRQLARCRLQRQNRVREQVQRRTTRSSFLHQPCQRSFRH
ncbi:hypothetical protein DNTS_032817 [Danionella cerebrum]|uniref:Tumor protein p53-inducible nuclear protein 2 n=1 Tax=Danionella cerebrum TaxID=2873325 RepID=A0A553QW26_9TELE|nr:hypothetical protein DNTS_032817 [Danionella translucida]TRY93996.1 hypothetical protein DNTS_032817 [Danionella translucida]